MIRRATAATDLAAFAAYRSALAVVAPEHGFDDLAHVQRPAPADVRHMAGDSYAAAEAIKEALYLAVTLFDVSRGALARQLGVTRQAVQKSVQRVVLRLDDEAYEERLALLEAKLMGAA